MRGTLTIAFTLLGAALAAHTAHAADYCRVYSGNHQTGTSYDVDLPAVDATYSPLWYGSSSRRRTGAEKSSIWYENGESIRIRAMESDVVFYAYDDDWMNGDFQAVRCKKGNTCIWNYGWMRNQMRSFNCQREFSGGQIPTNEIADELTIQLDTELPKSSNIKNSWIRYGKLFWTNVRSRCERKDVGCSAGWDRKYNDILEYNFKAELDVKPAIKHYDVWIDFWFHPQIVGTNKELHIDETYWRVSVESGVLHNALQDGIADEIKKLFDGGSDDVGEQVTDAIWDAVLDAVGGNQAFANLFMRANNRIEMTYDCKASAVEDHLVSWPGSDYSAAMLSNPCGARTPVSRFAPQMRLVKGF